MSFLTTTGSLKEYLGITSTTDDALMTRLISGSSDWFESQTGIKFRQTTVTESFTDDSGQVWTLDHSPVVSVSSVTVAYTGTVPPQSGSTSGFWVEGGLLRLSGDYRFTGDPLSNTVVYTYGYSPVPEDVEQAVIEHAALAYRNRTRVGIMNSSVGGENVSYQTTTVPYSIQSVVDAYRRLF